ncbi:MAG: hypothetical protein KAI66_00945 [Lentisphaeria bacterium]|nr:hypothetical protein [Lentisphaeria bacterium]
MASPIMKAKTLDEEPLIVAEVAPEDIVEMNERVQFPERKAEEYLRAKINEYPDKLIKGIADPNKEVEVKLNFDATAMTEIVPLFAELLNFSYLIDPGVKGAVTMSVNSEMTARETWELFEHILWLAGAYASKNPGYLHIMPFSKMPKEKRLLVQHEPLANVEVDFIPVFFVKSAEIIKNLQPFMTEGANITDLAASNTLLIVEAPANMPKLRELINRLDTKGEAAWPHICIRCEEVDVEELLQELQDLLPVLGFPVTNKGPSGGQIKLTAIPRLQTLVASAALPEVLGEVERWVKVLDRGDQSARESIFFYNVRHSTGEMLNEVLSVFFNTKSTVGSSAISKSKSTSAKATSGGSARDRRKSTTKKTSPKTPSGPRTMTGREPGDAGTVFDSEVLVYVDDVQGRLTIRTTHRTWALVKALLERQDVPPPQVMIEAAIVEITLNENTEFGFAYAVEHSDFQYASDHTSSTTSAWGDTGAWASSVSSVLGKYTTNPATMAGGAALGWMGGDDKMAFINAVAGKTNTRVLSAPQIMALTGEEASINVGTRVAIKTTEYYDNDDYANYEYQDTGTILTVTPFITAGNEVRVVIEQEVSDVIETSRADSSTPDISNKKLNTTLIIPDGGTIMMGGLIDTEKSDGHTGIPFLKDIPYLGRLFRTNVSSSKRTELLVLITVHVIDPDVGTEPLMRRYESALMEIKEQLKK